MKSNELMLGDWVYALSSRGEEFTATTVKNIYDADEDEPCGTIMEKYGRIIGSSEFKPIPLTQEILEKNGFKKHPDGWFHTKTLFRCPEINLSIYTSYNNQRMTLKYVHQLQHTLRFCGLNELADDFKIE